MRNLITIFLLIAALCLAWQYHEMSDAKAAAEARAGELSAEIESLRAELRSANAQIKQLGGKPGAKPGAKPNWFEEKIRNYQSPLTGSPGAPGGPGKGRQPTPPPPANR